MQSELDDTIGFGPVTGTAMGLSLGEGSAERDDVGA